MADYIVRLGFETSLVDEMWEKGILISEMMRECLEKYIVEAVKTDGLSYAVFIISSDNARECEKIIRDGWNEIFPGRAGALSVMMVEDDGSELSGVMKVIYDVYYGWEAYQKICTELTQMHSIVKNSPAVKSLIKTNYLASVDKGCGFRTMVMSFSDYMNKFGIFSEMKDFNLSYRIGAEDKNGMTSVDMLMDTLWLDENEYSVIGIDIEYFLDEEHYDELRNLLKLLDRVQDKYIFIFRIPYLEDAAYDNVKKLIEDIIPIRDIRITPYSDIILQEAACTTAANNGYLLGENMMNFILDRIHHEKMDGRFYGFKTINKIINEIVWAKLKHDANAVYCGDEFDAEVICLSDVEKLMPTEKEKKNSLDDLYDMVGMEEIAQRVKEMIAQITLGSKVNSMEKPCLHMRFVGAPGTGKTTVARIIGHVLKEQGILKKGAFFEYEARSLCGQYVGQTAPKTRSICRDAYGSILFIDEAYALYSGDDDRDYGREAITTLIAEMENHRDDMIVIMAGYPDEMDKLMKTNVGLRSRMPFVLEFKSYTKKQLSQIFMKMAGKSFECEEGLEEAVSEYFEKLSDRYISSKEFSNARFVRNLYERTWAKASVRIAEAGYDSIVLTRGDFELASQEKEFSEKLMHENRMGFGN